MLRISNRFRYNAAFTMIEVMAAMLILALVCVAYSTNQVASIQLVKATKFREMAIMLAAQKMADIDFQVQTKGIEIIKDQDRGEFDQEKFSTYGWTTEKIQIPPPDFSALMALSGGGDSGDEADSSQPPSSGSFEGPMKMITDAWGKSIFEVKLTVTWKEGEMDKSYDLVTHYIASNANQQIQGIVGAMTNGLGGGAGSDSSSESSGSSGSSASGTSSGSSGNSSGSSSGNSSGGFGGSSQGTK